MLNHAGFISIACILLTSHISHVCRADELAQRPATDKAPLDTFDQSLAPFLKSYCFECHVGEDAAGERNFDTLSSRISDENSLVEMQEILDQLNLGEMPPQESKQPSNEERRTATRWLTESIQQFHASQKSPNGDTVLRRLNSREYRNTIRDLLHLNMSAFDPTVTFPRDQTVDHLDNVGESLVMSGYLLSQYLTAAESIVNKAMQPVVKPEVQTWQFTDGFRQQPEIDQVHRDTSRLEYLILYDVIGADKHEGAYAPIHAFAAGVPFDGYYDIEFRAAAVNRLHPYDDKYLGRDSNEPLRLAIRAGNRDAGPLHKPQPVEPNLAELELVDGWQTYKVRVWLDAGYTPRFTFPNGLMDVRNLWGNLHKRFGHLLPKPKNTGIVEVRRNAIKNGKLPQIHVDDIRITGPFYDEWPTQAQQALLGDDWVSIANGAAISNAMLRTHLNRFASAAFRRPATDEEVDRLASIATTRMESGRSSLEAFGDAITCLLCSPAFLYLEESSSRQQFALASRLSYFLWASQPDEPLLSAATNGQLKSDEQLTAQVRRMLNDSRSNEMIDGFLDSWLTLRDLGSSPPDRSAFRAYYQYDLGTAMKQETHLFTRHLLDQNLSVTNFLDADFTFVNKDLARHYGIDGPAGSQFQYVRISDRRRGGILGQGSVLTVTANGIDTSPVVRGVWLLENILGTPPSPPPPDVEPLDPDVRGATTIRDQLHKHRNVPACYDCHRKIDPPGFALENFDAVGAWRDKYKRGANIDAAGELPNGKSFDDITELKQILVEQQTQFTLSLARKLLAYATGRTAVPADRPHLDAIVNKLQSTKGGFRDLIELVVLSQPFRSL